MLHSKFCADLPVRFLTQIKSVAILNPCCKAIICHIPRQYGTYVFCAMLAVTTLNVWIVTYENNVTLGSYINLR